jgi:hypothetical protein
VPEVVQAKRLGHRLPGIRGTYRHVSPAGEKRLTTWGDSYAPRVRPKTAETRYQMNGNGPHDQLI